MRKNPRCLFESDFSSFLKMEKSNLSMDCFWCEIAEGSPHLLEHEAAKWLPLHDLHQVKWLPADIKVVEAIEASVLSE